MPRYIDAEKLKWDYAWFGNSKSEQYRHMKATFDRYVDGQPTVDVVERKCGKWTLNKEGNWACPFCEFDPYHDEMNGMNY